VQYSFKIQANYTEYWYSGYAPLMLIDDGQSIGGKGGYPWPLLFCGGGAGGGGGRAGGGYTYATGNIPFFLLKDCY